MRIHHVLLPAAALGAAAALFVAPLAQSYEVLGQELDLSQRDFRVYNNFPGANANDNTVEDPRFPGATGAVLAIWKAAVEWGSRLHGDGEGDPHQPSDLGSGGANFDFSYQGEATGVGGVDDNVCSLIGGNAGGNYGFTEGPIQDGWRIRYYDQWDWDDGPGTSITGIDIQGVATHEFGHCLGLGHSTETGATMRAVITGDGVWARSLSEDDQAGVQAIYGQASPTKPIVYSAALDAGTVTIVGRNFDLFTNEVWFTRAGTGGDGTPVKVTGVIGQNGGTLLQVALPVEAGPGDVLVKINGSNNDDLSNAWPLDTRVDGGANPRTVCAPASTNSSGLAAAIGWQGTLSVANNDLTLLASNMPASTNGLFIYSPDEVSVPLGNGTLCVGNQTLGFVLRLFPITSDPQGEGAYPFDITMPVHPWGVVTPGSVWVFQLWYRDPLGGGAFFNFSDALEIQFHP